MRMKDMITQHEFLPLSAISDMWQYERRICSVMLEIKGLRQWNREILN